MILKYGEIKKAVLSHINQYSIAGEQIAPTYNNQDDYLMRIPHLINEGLVNVRTGVKMDPVAYPLENGEPYAGMTRYQLPADFYSLKTGGVSVVLHGMFHKTNEYKLYGRQYILVPHRNRRNPEDIREEDDPKYTIEYYRYPPQLPANPPDNFVVDEELDVIHAAILYAAADLVRYDDEFMYKTLYNDYMDRLGMIGRKVSVEVSPVSDAYDFSMHGEVYEA